MYFARTTKLLACSGNRAPTSFKNFRERYTGKPFTIFMLRCDRLPIILFPATIPEA